MHYCSFHSNLRKHSDVLHLYDRRKTSLSVLKQQISMILSRSFVYLKLDAQLRTLTVNIPIRSFLSRVTDAKVKQSGIRPPRWGHFNNLWHSPLEKGTTLDNGQRSTEVSSTNWFYTEPSPLASQNRPLWYFTSQKVLVALQAQFFVVDFEFQKLLREFCPQPCREPQMVEPNGVRNNLAVSGCHHEGAP